MIASSAMDVIQSVMRIGKEVNKRLTVTPGNASISRIARNAILEYPVIISKSLDFQEATMISKALERQYTSYVRLAMSLDDKLASGESKFDYIKKFHNQNNKLLNFGESEDLLNEKYATGDVSGINRFRYQVNQDNRNREFERERFEYQKSQDKIKNDLEREKLKAQSKNPVGRFGRVTDSPYKDQLLDSDVKKANEMVPTLLDITINNVDTKEFDHLMLGVKTILHPVTSDDMIYNVSTSLREKRNIFRFIQFTTGEIKFIKDYLLAADRMKQEALNKQTSPMWRNLRNISNISKVKAKLNSKDVLIPNCTIVLTMDEVETINGLYNIDILNNKKLVKQLISIFFLLGVVIVDSSAEVAYFFFDGHEDYQTFSFTALERENSNPQRDLKNMLSLIGR